MAICVVGDFDIDAWRRLHSPLPKVSFEVYDPLYRELDCRGHRHISRGEAVGLCGCAAPRFHADCKLDELAWIYHWRRWVEQGMGGCVVNAPLVGHGSHDGEPKAEWVGPHHIRMRDGRTLRPRRSDGATVMQLVSR